MFLVLQACSASSAPLLPTRLYRVAPQASRAQKNQEHLFTLQTAPVLLDNASIAYSVVTAMCFGLARLQLLLFATAVQCAAGGTEGALPALAHNLCKLVNRWGIVSQQDLLVLVSHPPTLKGQLAYKVPVSAVAGVPQ